MILHNDFIQYVQQWESKINAFIELDLYRGGSPLVQCDNAIPNEAVKLVGGLPFAVKDNIAVKGMALTCGSKLLEHFRSPYTATVVQKLEAVGGVVIGKTNLDEFGMGSSSDNSAFKKTNNPWDIRLSPGGSSGGSAAAVAAGIVPYALGTDTGGSTRQPAALCGVIGLKPTYGAVSRYGLTAYASSLETAGVLADTVSRCRAVFAIIRNGGSLSGPQDQSSGNIPDTAASLYPMTAQPGTKKIGILSRAETGMVPEAEVCRGFELAGERLAAMGHTLADITIPGLQYAIPAYYTIASAEAGANLARFDGIRYGKRPEQAASSGQLITEARRAGFGPEVKLRILLGTYVLRSGFQERYYLRAQKIRACIREHFEKLLNNFDAILMPVYPTRAFGRNRPPSPLAQKAADLYTCCANLAGLPALSFPASLEGGLPVGVQLIGRAHSEGTLFDIAESYERQYPLPHPPGFKSFWA